MLSMKCLLQEKNCYMKDRIKDWKEAIHIACAPLIEQNYCTADYEYAIIKITRELGPYYVLCENLALLHASNQRGVLATQMAVTVLKEPVKFKLDGYDVRVLITLVAKDKESHIEGMQAVSNIFMDKSKVQSILDATNAKEIYDVFISNAF